MNLSELSTEELIALAQKKVAPPAPAGGDGVPSLSQVPTEDLVKMLQGAISRPAPEPSPTDNGVRPAMASAMKREARKRRGVETPGKGESYGFGALNGLIPGWMDEVAGGVTGAFDTLTKGGSLTDNYYRAKKEWDERSDAAWDEHPWAYGAGMGTGIVGSALLLPEVKGATMAATGARTGATYGALSGLGEGDTWAEGALNAGIGGAGGAVLGYGLGRFGDRAQARRADRAGQDFVEDQLARIAQQDAGGIPLSWGTATGDVTQQAFENSARNTAYGPAAQRAAEDYGERLTQGIDNRIDSIGDDLAGGRRLVNNETDGGQRVAEALRAREAQADDIVDRAYENFRATPGEFDPAAVTGIDGAVRSRVEAMPNAVPIVRELTPAANAALDYLARVGRLEAPINRASGPLPLNGGAPPTIAGISADGVEAARKTLRRFASMAKDPTDRTAVGQLIQAFDEHIAQAVQDGLWSGDPAVINTIQTARGLHRQFMETFHPANRDSAIATVMRQIIDRDATPEQVVGYLFGSRHIGSGQLNSRVAEHLRGIFGEGSDEWNAIRQAGWRYLTSSQADLGAGNTRELANRIEEALTNRGRSLTHLLYTPEEREAMLAFARTLRRVGGAASAKNPPNTANQGMRMLRENYRMILGMLGFASGDVTGAVHGFAVGQAGKMIGDAAYGAKARASFAGRRPPSITRSLGGARDRLGLGLGDASPLLSRQTGHVVPFKGQPAVADDDNPQPLTFSVSPGARQR